MLPVPAPVQVPPPAPTQVQVAVSDAGKGVRYRRSGYNIRPGIACSDGVSDGTTRHSRGDAIGLGDGEV